MNFLALCNRARNEAGITGTQVYVTTAAGGSTIDQTWAQWINDAYEELWNLRKWNFSRTNFTFATVSGTRDYTTSVSTVREWDRRYGASYIVDSSSVRYPLYWMPYGDFREQWELASAQSARPNYITDAPSNTLRFSTTPNAAETVSLWGWLDFVALSETTDTPSAIPTADQMAIVWGAVRYYAENDDAEQLYKAANRKYMSSLRRLCNSQLDDIKDYVEPLA